MRYMTHDQMIEELIEDDLKSMDTEALKDFYSEMIYDKYDDMPIEDLKDAFSARGLK